MTESGSKRGQNKTPKCLIQPSPSNLHTPPPEVKCEQMCLFFFSSRKSQPTWFKSSGNFYLFLCDGVCYQRNDQGKCNYGQRMQFGALSLCLRDVNFLWSSIKNKLTPENKLSLFVPSHFNYQGQFWGVHKPFSWNECKRTSIPPFPAWIMLIWHIIISSNTFGP